MSNKRIVSGMRSTGKLHMGHYLGVLQNWIKLQNEYDSFFFIADLHALTTKYNDTSMLAQNVYDVALDWLACGIDPNKSTIYVQSHIPQISQLHIYLSMITPQNWVERDPTLKDMAKALRTGGADSQISYGLMGYPVLMSADIMMLGLIKWRMWNLQEISLEDLTIFINLTFLKKQNRFLQKYLF